MGEVVDMTLARTQLKTVDGTLVVIPNKHIPSVAEMTAVDELIMGKLFSGAKYAAEKTGIDKSGFRLIVNNGPNAHQEIFHIHMHLLGGDEMKHPMG